MSHTTEITDIVFNDIEALKLAVGELRRNGIDCELKQKATARAYYPDQSGMAGEMDYVLRLKGAPYDVAFVKTDDGKGYAARTDLWNGNVERVLGATAREGESKEQAALGKLNQMYAVHAATRQAAKQGFSVRRVTKPDGSIQLVINA